MVALSRNAAFIRRSVIAHNKLFEESIPLIASENVISPLQREMLNSDMNGRYAEGWPEHRYYQGNKFVDEVELKGIELAKKLFRCNHADLRPISGTVANMSVLFALTSPGETITAPALSDGAHISTAKFGAVGFRGLNTVTYPFDTSIMNIDVDGTRKLLKEVRPKVALFGMSLFLFPVPLAELKDVFQELDVSVWYDGAHVLGLIAGGQFQDPLREGAHVISASTHKTFPGPNHGILLANPKDEEMEKSLKRAVFPGVTSNHHLHEMAALAVALDEMIRFGRRYAAQIVKNARALASALYDRGFDVLAADLGFTASHAIAVDVKKLGGGQQCAVELERANIIVNKNMIPGDESSVHPSGLRLGTQEVTHLGMGPLEMEEIADLMYRVLIKRERSNTVARDASALKRRFKRLKYCYGEGYPAYKYERFLR
ncbi:MAG: serine hydroxymethyltransferase [Methanomassiliicoccales archaeon]